MRDLRMLLEDLVNGKISIDEVEKTIRDYSVAIVGDFASVDLGRHGRKGIPEVVFAQHKDDSEVLEIVRAMVSINGFALVARAKESHEKTLREALPHCFFRVSGRGEHLTILAWKTEWTLPTPIGKIAIITAGTSDVPLAEEAAAVARVMGVESVMFHDVGVAGIHRLLEPIRRLRDDDVAAVIVVAGMEGALPAVVTALVDVPVIGLPSPTGYGFGGEGVGALTSMLQSCSPGLAVVNIGNGIGAGAFAALVARARARCTT